jgi:hypothetical protein
LYPLQGTVYIYFYLFNLWRTNLPQIYRFFFKNDFARQKSVVPLQQNFTTAD